MTSDFVAAANENFRAAFAGLSDQFPEGEACQFGHIAVVSTGLSFPEYNRAFVFDPPSREELTKAVSWLQSRDDPFWVTMTTSALEAVEGFPAEFDLKQSHEQAGMVLPSLAEQPLLSLDEQLVRESPAAISPVTDAAALDEFVAVFTTVFDRPEDVTTRVYQPSVSEEKTQLFVGRVDGQAVACGLLFQHDDVAGVYAIGVVESFRRQGIGAQMTREVLQAGRAAGCRVGVLQPSESAYSLYETMGFEPVVSYHHFEPAT